MNLHFNRFSNPGSFFIGGSKSESAGIDQRIIIDFHADDIARDAGLIVHDRNPPARKTVKNPAFAHIGPADDGYDTRISHGWKSAGRENARYGWRNQSKGCSRLRNNSERIFLRSARKPGQARPLLFPPSINSPQIRFPSIRFAQPTETHKKFRPADDNRVPSH